MKSWAEQTTPDFRFILKLPKAITHERRLADVEDPLRAFLAAIEPLGQRTHTLWIQLPRPSAPPTSALLPVSCATSRRSTGPPSRSGIARSSRTRDRDNNSKRASVTSEPNGLPSTPPSCSRALRGATPNGRHGRRSHACPAGHAPSLPIPSSATSAAMTRHAQSRDGSTGSIRLPAGCVRAAPRQSSSTRPTTSTRSSWPADSTTRCEPGCPKSSRSRSRSPPDRRLCSEPGAPGFLPPQPPSPSGSPPLPPPTCRCAAEDEEAADHKGNHP